MKKKENKNNKLSLKKKILENFGYKKKVKKNLILLFKF